jgi:hypothetical protein
MAAIRTPAATSWGTVVETRFVENEEQRQLWIRYIQSLELPFAASIFEGSKRSLAQNRLQRLLCNEIASQWDGHAPEYVRAYCKLTIGVPLLRAASEAFREKYDRLLKPMTFEQKIEIMAEPMDLPVTRIMTVGQKSEYLNGIYDHFTDKGFILTKPEGELGL